MERADRSRLREPRIERVGQLLGWKHDSQMPSIREMIELCERLIAARRAKTARWSSPRTTNAERWRNAPPNRPSGSSYRPSGSATRKPSGRGEKPRSDGCKAPNGRRASGLGMTVHCRATSNLRMAYRPHWFAAQESASHGKPHAALGDGEPVRARITADRCALSLANFSMLDLARSSQCVCPIRRRRQDCRSAGEPLCRTNRGLDGAEHDQCLSA